MTERTLREKIIEQREDGTLMTPDQRLAWDGAFNRVLAVLDAHTAEQPAPATVMKYAYVDGPNCRVHTPLGVKPAPDAVAEAAIADDDSLAKRISELGWQIHNLGCEYQNDEKLLDRLQDLRGMAWEIADTVREGAA